MARKYIAVPEDLHALWAKAADDEGLTIAAYVTGAVEARRAGMMESATYPVLVAKMAPPKVKPADCTNRLRAGTYCRICGAIHMKGT